MKSICKIHGETEFGQRKDRSKGRCKKCQVEAVRKRRNTVKLKAIDYKGGCCERCGYNKCVGALEFHHTDPKKKDFSISKKGYSQSWSKVQKELDKCRLVCANCHREIHEELGS